MRMYGRIFGEEQENVMAAENCGRYKTEVEERIKRRERLALRNEVKHEKNVFAPPNGLRENAETAISCK